MHADRINRSVLIVLSLLLIAAGVLGLVAGLGGLGSVTRHGALTHNRVGAFIGRHGDWLWPAAAVAALLLAGLAVRALLVLLLSTDRAGELRFGSEQDGPGGRTTLSDTALTAAVTEEIQSYRGVHTTRARLIADHQDPSLVVEVSLEHNADLPRLRTRIENGALTHARHATGNPELPIRLNLTITNKQASRTI